MRGLVIESAAFRGSVDVRAIALQWWVLGRSLFEGVGRSLLGGWCWGDCCWGVGDRCWGVGVGAIAVFGVWAIAV